MTCKGHSSTHHAGCCADSAASCAGHTESKEGCQLAETGKAHEGCCHAEDASTEHMQQRLDYLEAEAHKLRERLGKA